MARTTFPPNITRGSNVLGGGGSGSSVPTNSVELAQSYGAVTIFPFTDTSGTDVTDEGVGAKPGSTYGAGINLNQAPPGDLLGAIDLPGTAGTQAVTISSYENLNTGVYTDAFSVELVAKIDGAGTVGSTTHAALFGINGTHRFLVQVSDGALTVAGGDAWTAAAGTFPVGGTWFHMALTYDHSAATRNKLYVNGTLKAVSLNTASILPAILTRFGSYDGSNYMLNGGLAFAAIYRYPLSGGQVTALNTMAGL